MRIDAKFRRRAMAEENVALLNETILEKLFLIDGLMKYDRKSADVKLDIGSGESASLDMSSLMNFKMRGAISYSSRIAGAIRDKAMCDDFFTIRMDSGEVNFSEFSKKIFPAIVSSFDAYRAVVVTDIDLNLDDFEDAVAEARKTGLDIDGRNTVFRFHPVNYFDEVLCSRAFGLSAADLVTKLQGKIIVSEYLNSGAFLVASDVPVTGKQSICLDANIRRLVGE